MTQPVIAEPVEKEIRIRAVSSIELQIRETFPEDPDTAVAIAHCESRLNPDAVNDNPDTGDYSIGLFQINLHGNLAEERPSEEWLKNPENNIKYARKLYDEREWQPWSCRKLI